MERRRKKFQLELLITSLLGVAALFFCQKNISNILIFISHGGFLFILLYIGWMYFYYRRYVLYGSARLRPAMLCLNCGEGIHGSDDGWGFKVYGNVKPKFFQFSVCATPDLCDIEYFHLSKWRPDPRNSDEYDEPEEGKNGLDSASCLLLEEAASVEVFEPAVPLPESDPIPLPVPYAIPNLGIKPATGSASGEPVSTYSFGDYPYSVVGCIGELQRLYVGNSEVATSQNGAFEFTSAGQRINVYCHGTTAKQQIEVVHEGVLVFRGLPDPSGRWVRWLVGSLVVGLLVMVVLLI